MKTILTATGLLVFLAAGSIHGQVRQPIAVARRPFPTVTVGGWTVATPVITEFPANTQTVIVGSVWNQTTANKASGHPFQFPRVGGGTIPPIQPHYDGVESHSCDPKVHRPHPRDMRVPGIADFGSFECSNTQWP